MIGKITRKQQNVFLEKHSSSKRTLDIGGEKGKFDNLFPNRVSINIDPKRKPDRVGDAHNLPFNDEEFDVVLCSEVLEHLEDPRKAISEMRRVLKKDGKVVLTTRFIFPLHDTPADYWRFTKYGLNNLFKEKNWQILEITEETKVFSTFAALMQRICYQTNFKFMNKPIKLIIFVLAWFLKYADGLVKEQFGDIKKEKKDSEIFTTGYYLAARRR